MQKENPNELHELVGQAETEGLSASATAERRYLQLELLKRAVDPDDHPLMDYIEKVGPCLLEELSLVPAKGGAGRSHPNWNPRWSENPDQSLLSHVLNGIFPTLRIVRRSGQAISNEEERLYLVAYTLHDLDKLVQIQGLSVADEARKEQFFRLLDSWLDRLNVRAFFPQVDHYKEDLAWLILNTQQVWGANRNLAGFALTLPTRRLNVLQEMCTFSDKIAYFVKTPTDVARRVDLQEGLLKLSRGKFEFAYHQLAENRGMLTNVINNALLALLRDECGWLPLLFFPTGVVYLRPRNRDAQKPPPPLEVLAEQVEARLRAYCRSRLEQGLMGFTRDNKRLKFPDYYHQFFDIQKLLHVVVKGTLRVIHEGKSPASGKRREKLRELQSADPALQGVDLEFDEDIRVDQLAEFCDQVERILGTIVGREKAADAVLQALELEALRGDFRAIPRDRRTGGVPLHWYFAAGKYLQRRRGLSKVQMRQLLEDVADRVCTVFAEEVQAYDQKQQQEGFSSVRVYVQHVVDINANATQNSNGRARDFARELARYESTKRPRSGEVGCSLCSSPFATTEQREAEVIFAPQVYTNKRPLNSTQKERGICELCRVELMLRQILVRSRRRLVGKDYEDAKVKWLYLYPSYFFTTETARFAREAYLQLRHLNFFEVRRALRERTAAEFLRLDEALIDVAPPQAEKDPLLKMEFDPNDLATFYFCGIPSMGQQPTDTESWAIPAFLGFLMALVFNAKVVVSESIVPLFNHGEEFKETVVLDGPHGFILHLLHKDRFRIDEVLEALRILTSAYDLNIDVFQKEKNPNWTRLAGVARDLDTDKLYVFHYLRAWQRKEGKNQIPSEMATKYRLIYEHLGGDRMGLIQGVGERCFRFYGPDGFASNAILRVLSLVEDVIINSSPDTPLEDVRLQARGEITRFMGRVRDGRAKGYAYLPPDEEANAIAEFVDHFFDEVFLSYCRGERALLRERRNRFNAGVEAWYLENWRRLSEERRNRDRDRDEETRAKAQAQSSTEQKKEV